MSSPTKPKPWPTELELDGIVAALSKRAISLDAEDAATCEDESLMRDDSVVGTLAPTGTITWQQGRVASLGPRRDIEPGEVAPALRRGCTLFLQRGTNYRSYAVPEGAVVQGGDGPATEASGDSLASPTAAAASSGEGGESPQQDGNSPDSSPDASSGSRGARGRKQYSQAVAFEFVSGVLGNVLGEDNAAKAWTAPA